MFSAFAQQFRSCLVRLGITKRVFQKVAYVRYFWHTFAVLFIKYDCTIYQSVRLVGDHRTFVLKDSSVRLAFKRTSALKDRGVLLPTIAYIRSKSPILQNALLAYPSDPKSKLTL